MAARNAEIELTYLEREGERWQFAIKETPITPLTTILHVYLSNVSIITPLNGSGLTHLGKLYDVSDQVMWLLSHLFKNWSEMHEKASQPKRERCASCGKTLFDRKFSRPSEPDAYYCEACLQKHLYEYMKEKEQASTSSKRPYCVECGNLHRSSYYTCHICHVSLCYSCLFAHERRHQPQEERVNAHAGAAWENLNFRINIDTWDIEESFRRMQEELARKQTQGRFTRDGRFGTTAPPPRQPIAPTHAEQSAFTQLGMKPSTDQAAIRKAFSQKAKSMHPDTGGAGGDLDALTRAKETALGYAQRAS